MSREVFEIKAALLWGPRARGLLVVRVRVFVLIRVFVLSFAFSFALAFSGPWASDGSNRVDFWFVLLFLPSRCERRGRIEEASPVVGNDLEGQSSTAELLRLAVH